jgi:tripartite-type tricarboxylate transporter receptor subunit TctC
MISRRHLLRCIAGIGAMPCAVNVAFAQGYPTGVVKILVGATAGGGTDIMARVMAQWLSARLGQPFIVDDRPGAGSNIATDAVVRAAPDGHTLLLVMTANAINATLYDNLKFDFIRDIEPVAGLVRVPLMLVVNPALPVTTVPEFVDYAKKNSGKVNLATGVIGGPPHVAGELFKKMTGVQMTQIPYRGLSVALADVVGGQVQALFSGIPAASELIKAGKVRALAVTTTERAHTHPDIPSVSEFVPGFEASQWYGFGAPRGTPPEVIGVLNREINAGLADPQLKKQLVDLGGIPISGTPSDFRRLIASETEKWGEIVRLSGAKAN